MAVREKIREIKHLRNKYFICVLENPTNIMNIAATLRNVSAFGVEKLYVIGDKAMVRGFEDSRKNSRLTKLSVGSNKWVFVKRFDTARECITHLKKNLYTTAVTSSHKKGKRNTSLSSTGIILSYIGYQRLKWVYEYRKITFKPKGKAVKKMSSWETFVAK